MMNDTIERRIFKEQIRKELLDEFKGYLVGWAHDGEITALKDSGNWSGYIFLIPEEKYKEFFP